jgi:hypothetical protein
MPEAGLLLKLKARLSPATRTVPGIKVGAFRHCFPKKELAAADSCEAADFDDSMTDRLLAKTTDGRVPCLIRNADIAKASDLAPQRD